MNGRTVLSWRDYFFLLVAVVFLFGCVASSHRSGKTLDQGQVSMGIAYDGLHNIEESEADMIQLLAVDGRVGVVNGLDVGVAHTWDVTALAEGAFSTWWGDAKWQLTNKDNVVGRPILSLGIIKGYAYHEDAKTHITSFPVMFSLPISETTTSYFIYRFENLTEDFIPEEWEYPRHGFFLGSERELGGSDGGFTPVLGVDIGLMNSLYGGEGDMVLVLNAGVSFNSPSK
ncbi:MAG: hypothetical protein KAW67_08105 [Candidatus Eisenbacteria sp.]|nr:hypothetical protein [Candidatus Eisenbacteria bacterium]